MKADRQGQGTAPPGGPIGTGRRRRLPGMALVTILCAAAVLFFLFVPVAPRFTDQARPAAAGTDGAARPIRHVLLITVDTLRPDYLGFAGYPGRNTPLIDQLLERGTYFRGAVTPIPRTSQALGSLLTGCYPQTTGLRWLFGSLSADARTLAQSARRAGFRTVAVVSNHVLTPERGLDRGFDIYDHADDARDAQATTERALRILSGAHPAEPLFVWVHYIDPHVPYFPPAEVADLFDPAYRGRYRRQFGGERGHVGQNAYPADLPKKEAVYRNPLPETVNAHVRRLYAADIFRTDLAVGRLVRALEQRFGHSWLTVFTSDHGESLGEHDYFWDHGDDVYTPGLAVPLAFIFPEGHPLHGPRLVDQQVSLVDVAPTLAELAGWEELPGAIGERGGAFRGGPDGRSLVPLFREEALPPVPLFAECGVCFYPDAADRRVRFDVSGRFRAVMLDGWKLIWTPGAGPGEAFELYRLADDPGETKDLASVGKEEAARLRHHLSAWVEGDPLAEGAEPPQPSERDLRLLRSLGYVE